LLNYERERERVTIYTFPVTLNVTIKELSRMGLVCVFDYSVPKEAGYFPCLRRILFYSEMNTVFYYHFLILRTEYLE
jgi:hypothetical protein